MTTSPLATDTALFVNRTTPTGERKGQTWGIRREPSWQSHVYFLRFFLSEHPCFSIKKHIQGPPFLPLLLSLLQPPTPIRLSFLGGGGSLSLSLSFFPNRAAQAEPLRFCLNPFATMVTKCPTPLLQQVERCHGCMSR